MRLGGSDEDSEAVKHHPFFEGTNWGAMSKKEIPAIFKPELSGNKDTSYIDMDFLMQRPMESPTMTTLRDSQKA